LSIAGSSVPLLEHAVGNIRTVNSEYFRTVGMSLQAGRLFSDADQERQVAVLSMSIAKRAWPGEDPVGKRFHFGPPTDPDREVIGVVNDVRDTCKYLDSSFRHNWQFPAAQISPVGQRWPQTPQFEVSVCKLTQVPGTPHLLNPGGHEVQPPRKQFVPLVQTKPQVPQFELSSCKLTQVPEQKVNPGGQVQLPAAQIWPLAQAMPQAPQFEVSSCKLTQVPEQKVNPGGHEVQLPATQVWPPVQAIPHPPQLALSTSVFLQTPLQFVKPAAHITWHTPFWHILKPSRVGGQAFPQEPQFIGSNCVSVHTPAHTEKGAGQRGVQAPAAQNVPGGHTFPHPPQF
jgi:hypothetical protein